MLGLGNSLVGGAPIRKFSNFSGSFDGSADFVLLPEVAALKPTSALSISLWAKPNAWEMTNGGNDDYFLGCISGGGWGIYLRNSGANVTEIWFAVSVADNGDGGTQPDYLIAKVNEATTEALTGWHNIIATYDGTTAKLYVDGGTTGVTNHAHGVGSTQAINYHSSNARPVMLGADAAGSDTTASDWYHGLLSNVAIFNAALSSGDASTIYNNGNPNDISGMSNLVGYWRFEEGTGTSIADDSSNSNDGGEGNAWSWSTDTP